MGESSKTVPIVLTLIALLLGYAAYTGDGISMLGMSGVQTRAAHADSLRDSLVVVQARIDTAKRDLARESVEDLAKRVTAYRSSLALLRTLVPEQREVNNMLDDVNLRSRVRGVRMTAFKPSAPKAGPAPFDTYGYDFVVVGRYHQVAAFLTDIASLRRIMVPGDVKLVGATQAQGRAFGDTTSMLEAHFTVRTYVKSRVAEDSTHAK
ncbi:MAG: type 4a pilus biogenesis protein PilO [Gemmatimonadales bacterium]